MRKLLFSRESEVLQPLRQLVEEQTHKTLIVWALECATPYLEYFEQQTQDSRPKQALETAARWAHGQAKMPEAKRAIHAAHRAAAAVGDNTKAEAAVMAAARAVGHAAATVHVETHALGLAFYGLTSIVYQSTANDCTDAVQQEIARLYSRLQHWQQNISNVPGPWAAFLQEDVLPNKEALLHLREDAKKSATIQ